MFLYCLDCYSSNSYQNKSRFGLSIQLYSDPSPKPHPEGLRVAMKALHRHILEHFGVSQRHNSRIRDTYQLQMKLFCQYKIGQCQGCAMSQVEFNQLPKSLHT